jgi:putative membrane protein
MFNSYEFNVMQSLSGLIPFISYFGLSFLMVIVFAFVYTKFTPHDEFALIKQNNEAAAISFGGALLGFVLALTAASKVSVNLMDFAIWGVVAMVVQISVFALVRLSLPAIVERINTGENAKAILLASISISAGLINAASMSN